MPNTDTAPPRARRSRLARVFQWRFWVNLLVVLVATCWIPLLTQTAVMKDQEGNVLNSTTLRFRAYQSWAALAVKPSMPHAKAVGLHLGISFMMCFAVWFAAAGRDKPAAPPEEPQDAPEND